MPAVTQEWTHALPLMQQSVLLSAFDGVALETPWELGGGSFTGPSCDEVGPIADGPFIDSVSIRRGDRLVESWDNLRKPSFAEQLEFGMATAVDDFIRAGDELPHHYYTHFMHAAEVLGYKHPHQDIRAFWYSVYERLVHALHLYPESEAQMDARLGDTIDGWRARSDKAACCSD